MTTIKRHAALLAVVALVCAPAWAQVVTQSLGALAYLNTATVARGGTGQTSAGLAAINAISGLSVAGTTGNTATNWVFSNNATMTAPTFTTPTLGVASATSISFTDGTCAISAPGWCRTSNLLVALSGTAGGQINNDIGNAGLWSWTNAGVMSFNTTNYNNCAALTTVGAVITCTVSAKRFKNALGDLARDGVGNLDSLVPAVWTYRDTKKYGANIHVGLYADDVAKMDPRCGVYDDDGYVQNYEDRCVIAYLVAESQKMKREIAVLRSVRR